MFKRVGIWIVVLGTLQILLLLLFYQPFPKLMGVRVLDWLYVALFPGNTIMLIFLAYRASFAGRPLLSLLAAVLSLPGIAYSVFTLVLLATM